jgi:hypothetical protein
MTVGLLLWGQSPDDHSFYCFPSTIHDCKKSRGELYTRRVAVELIFSDVAHRMTLGISDDENHSRIPFDPIHTHYLFHTNVPRSSPPLRVTAFDDVCRPLALYPTQPYSSLDTIDKVRKADDPPGPGKEQGSAQTCMTREVTMMVVAKEWELP